MQTQFKVSEIAIVIDELTCFDVLYYFFYGSRFVRYIIFKPDDVVTQNNGAYK